MKKVLKDALHYFSYQQKEYKQLMLGQQIKTKKILTDFGLWLFGCKDQSEGQQYDHPFRICISQVRNVAEGVGLPFGSTGRMGFMMR